MYNVADTREENLGFWEFLLPLVTNVTSAAVQLKAQKQAAQVEKARIQAIQNQQILQAQGSGSFGGISPLMIGALVGIPLLAFMFMRK